MTEFDFCRPSETANLLKKPQDHRWGAARGLPWLAGLLVSVCAAAFLLARAITGSSFQSLNWAVPSGDSRVGLSSAEELQPVLASSIQRLQSGEARLVYYHVHKSGGSSMCNAMVQMQMPLMGCVDRHKDLVVVSSLNTNCNCNGHKDLLPSIFATGAPDDEMEAYLRGRHPRAFFDEQGVADQPYWGPMLVHTIVVRHPVRRYMSDVFHTLENVYSRQGKQYNVAAVDSSAEALAAVARQRGDPGYKLDNFLTRYAGGYSRRSVPVVTAEHYQAALRNLQRMQVVLVLEEAQQAAGLLEGVGLQPFKPETRAGTQASQLGKHEQLSPEAYAAVAALHHWDLLLYDWCLQRHRQTAEAFRRLSR